MKKMVLLIATVIIILAYESQALERIDHVRWVNAVVEIFIACLGAYLFIWNKPQINPTIITVLDAGFYLFFFSMLIDSLDQFYVHKEFYTAFLEKSTLLVSVLLIIFGIGRWFVLNQELNAELVERSYTDDLTQLLNRRGIMNHLTQLEDSGDTGDQAFIVMDVDDFKVINDKFGHFVGDRTLQRLGSYFNSIAKDNWAVGRWGGEEFIIVLTGASKEVAVEVAETIRRAVHAIKPVREHDTFNISLSLGVSVFQPEDGNYLAAVCRADQLLYQAKNGGKNQVCSEP